MNRDDAKKIAKFARDAALRVCEIAKLSHEFSEEERIAWLIRVGCVLETMRREVVAPLNAEHPGLIAESDDRV
jgi:hypothetical protein